MSNDSDRVTMFSPSPEMGTGRIERLTEINLNDLFESFKINGLQGAPRSLAHNIFQPAARRFAGMIDEFDTRVGVAGLSAGSEWLLRSLSNTLYVTGDDHIPESGPVLLVCNHPGLTDTIALFTALPRYDLKIIAAKRPFLNELDNVSRQLIFINEGDQRTNISVVRAGVRHLQSGSTLITFPGGQIDPDPAVTEGAIDALAKWSSSIALFVRKVPEVSIIPTIVSGVISAKALHNPIVRLYSSKQDREWAAATLQLAIPFYRSVDVTVAFGEPIQGTDVGHLDPDSLLDVVTQQMSLLIKQTGHPRYRTGHWR